MSEIILYDVVGSLVSVPTRRVGRRYALPAAPWGEQRGAGSTGVPVPHPSVHPSGTAAFLVIFTTSKVYLKRFQTYSRPFQVYPGRRFYFKNTTVTLYGLRCCVL